MRFFLHYPIHRILKDVIIAHHGTDREEKYKVALCSCKVLSITSFAYKYCFTNSGFGVGWLTSSVLVSFRVAGPIHNTLTCLKNQLKIPLLILAGITQIKIEAFRPLT